jgi:hypothetical protein
MRQLKDFTYFRMQQLRAAYLKFRYDSFEQLPSIKIQSLEKHSLAAWDSSPKLRYDSLEQLTLNLGTTALSSFPQLIFKA